MKIVIYNFIITLNYFKNIFRKYKYINIISNFKSFFISKYIEYIKL